MNLRSLNRKIAGIMAAAVFAGSSLCTMTSFAAFDWIGMPGADDVTAEGAIVMEADTGAVLWGKNISTQYCPASITKLMTALVVLDKCSLDEEVTVTSEAVTSLEAGASTVGLGAGDVLTVEELLYTLLLRSANDSANVLAIHASGSIDAFAEEMTAKARELGCQNTIFRNPSGLTTPENLTTAYDMALIGAECSRNEEILKIDNSLSYDVSGDSRFPEGFTVYQEHKMLLNGTAYSDSRVICGKTGYITASGNTLVTVAEDNGLKLVAVVLRDRNPQHYIDTETMLNFGFDNFANQTIEDPLTGYDVVNRLIADKVISSGNNNITAVGSPTVTLPAGASLSDVTVSYDYNVAGTSAPEMAVAKMIFKYAGVSVGSMYLVNEIESQLVLDGFDDTSDHGSHLINININAGLVVRVIIVLAAAAAVGAVVMIIVIRRRRAAEMRRKRLERRRRRLAEMNVSEDEFAEMVRNKGKRGADTETDE